ncbi:phage tail sheath family protein [Streptomyces sp. NPDC091259]|uniref:phage tail sheath family protein n=1 Tax=Streptomyces sp. NPDC091259 TaxID=3365976 RepID=UPI00380E6213
MKDPGSTAVSPFLAYAVYGWFANGGGDCWVAGAGEGGPHTGYEAALAALPAATPRWTIVVVPDLWETQDDGAAIAKMVARHCADARNRMALLHTAQDAEPGKVPALLDLDPEEAQFTTVYHPWLHVSAGGGAKDKVVPPSGHVAGTWARTDNEQGVHMAPTDVGIREANGLERTLTDAEQGELNDAGVNCLRAFPGQGLLVCGARTLATDPEWRNLHVRRLANHLWTSIAQGTGWAVFEQNDERLHATVRASVTSFLADQWRCGALKGETADQAFHVTCDAGNNPGQGTDSGQIVIDVGFAAARPAEFTTIRITR